MPARFLGPGLAAPWRADVGGGGRRADVVVANGACNCCPWPRIAAGSRGARAAHHPRVGQGEQAGVPACAPRCARVPAADRRGWRSGGRWPVSVSGRRGGVRRAYGVGRPLPAVSAAGAAAGSGAGPPTASRCGSFGRAARGREGPVARRAGGRAAARDASPSLDVYGRGRCARRWRRCAAERPWVTLHGARPWPEVLAAQERAHVCLSTSIWDNVQVAVLEALARGVPVVSTRVGDAPRYYRVASLAGFCVERRRRGAERRAGPAGGTTRRSDERSPRTGISSSRPRDAPRILMELIADACRRAR